MLAWNRSHVRPMTGGDLKAAAAGNLDRARRSYSERAWADAFQAFSHADQESPLGAEDLEQLALSAYLVGRDEEYLKALERAYNAHRDVGERLRAVRCAFWLHFRLLMRSEMGRATGWLARAQRLLEGAARASCRSFAWSPRARPTR